MFIFYNINTCWTCKIIFYLEHLWFTIESKPPGGESRGGFCKSLKKGHDFQFLEMFKTFFIISSHLLSGVLVQLLHTWDSSTTYLFAFQTKYASWLFCMWVRLWLNSVLTRQITWYTELYVESQYWETCSA